MENILNLVFQKIIQRNGSLKLKVLTFLANSLPFIVELFKLGVQNMYIILVTALLITRLSLTRY